MTIDRTQCVTISNSSTAVVETLVTKRQPPLTFGSHWMNTCYRYKNESQPYVNCGPHLQLPYEKLIYERSLKWTEGDGDTDIKGQV